MALSLCGWLISRLFAKIGLGFLDRLLGLAFGALRAFLIIITLILLAGLSRLPQEPWWIEARFSRPLELVALSLKPYLPEVMSSRLRYRVDEMAQYLNTNLLCAV
ncbi:MAG: hypothetical protein RLZZ502_516, partial [Pseudomonadota bacterium]